MNIKTFEQITKEDIFLIGGKGTSLGIVSQLGIPIPPGFAYLTSIYFCV